MLASRLLRLCIPLLSYGVSGCSLFFVSGPPRDALNEEPYANVERWADDVDPDPSRAFDSASAAAKRGSRPDPIECTSSRAWPIVDTVSASINASIATLAAMSAAGPAQQHDEVLLYGLVALGSAALWGGSAIYGFSKTSECRAAKRAAAKREPAEER